MTPREFLAEDPCPCQIDGYIIGLDTGFYDHGGANDQSAHRDVLVEARAARMKASKPCGGDECKYKRTVSGRGKAGKKTFWELLD